MGGGGRKNKSWEEEEEEEEKASPINVDTPVSDLSSCFFLFSPFFEKKICGKPPVMQCSLLFFCSCGGGGEE